MTVCGCEKRREKRTRAYVHAYSAYTRVHTRRDSLSLSYSLARRSRNRGSIASGTLRNHPFPHTRYVRSYVSTYYRLRRRRRRRRPGDATTKARGAERSSSYHTRTHAYVRIHLLYTHERG